MMLSRLALYVLGFLWIPEELVARKRGFVSLSSLRWLLFVKAFSSQLSDTNWSPKAGDIIVSNWSSWIDILWLSYR